MTAQRITPLACLFALLSTLPAIAQDGPPAYQHLKPLEAMIGEWTNDFDPPGPAPAGTLTIRFEWLGNKSYLQSRVLFQPTGQPAESTMNPEFTVLGYDLSASEPKAWIFKYTDQGKLNAVIENARLVLSQQEGKPGDAKYRKQTKTYQINGDENLVITTTGESSDGKQNREPTITLRRAK